MRCWLPLLLIVALPALISGCGGNKKTKPLPDVIIGEWEVLCRTDREAASKCLGKEDMGMFKVFRPGGALTSGSRQGTSMEGTWTLKGNELVLKFTGGGMQLTERYRARIDKGRLVMWHIRNEFGVVYGRKGAKFVATKSPTTDGKPITNKLGGLRYTLTLPAKYRLSRNDNNRQHWSPISGDGLWVRLTVSPRSKARVDGKWVTTPCNDYDYGGVSGSSGVVDGIRRDTSVGTSTCVNGAELVMVCSGEHTRGWLDATEKDAALALCKSLRLAR